MSDEDDADRFTAVFRRYHPRILAYALRRADEGHAEDVVAETFTAAWRHIGRLPDDPLAWLYRTAHNCLANQRRSSRRQLRLAGRVAGHLATATVDIPDHSAGVVEGAHLRAALAALPPNDREALLLVSWEGLDHHTAAYVTGCSPPPPPLPPRPPPRPLEGPGRPAPKSDWAPFSAPTARCPPTPPRAYGP